MDTLSGKRTSKDRIKIGMNERRQLGQMHRLGETIEGYMREIKDGQRERKEGGRD